MAEQGNQGYGGFWARLVAYGADSAILLIATFVLLFVLSFLGEGMAVIGFGIAGLAQLVYWPLMHASRRQATLGKQLMGLKVVRADNGERISILRALGRDIVGKIISSAVFMLGFLMVAFTGRKQGLHDLVASTTVVREGPSRTMVALAVAVVGTVIPVIAVPLLLGGMMAGMMAGMMGGDAAKPPAQPVPQVAQQAPKPAAPPPAAPQPAVAPQAVAAKAPAPQATAPQPAVVPQAAAPKAPTPQPVKVAEAVKSAPPAAPMPVKAAADEEPSKPEPSPRTEPKPRAAVAIPPRPTGPSVPGPRYNDLTTAVLYRDTATVAELIAMGKWVDKPDSRGRTPLMTAVELEDAVTAEVLLKAGADVDRGMSVAREFRNQSMQALMKRYGAR